MPVDPNLIAELPLFRGLSTIELEEIASHLEFAELPAKTLIIKEGDEPNHPMFVLLSGTVEVTMRGRGNRDHVISTLNAPTVFGEVEILAKRAAVAGVLSTTPVKLARLRRGLFDELFTADRSAILKVVKNIARTLAYRLAATDGRLAAVFEGDKQVLGQVRRDLLIATPADN